jgi:SAM-dependent methyltransferase
MRSADVSRRTEILLGSVSNNSRIIEIGPCFDPIAPKSAGWNSVSIDHLTREGLAAKYEAHPGVDVSMIEPVDFVWTGGMLSDAVPSEQHGEFDVFLASHVIEHTPDLIAFLDAAQTLLKQDGVVILAVPDKRYCFDYFQPPTTTGQVLEASAKHRRRHSGERAFDHFAYAVTDGGAESWGQRPSQGLRLIHRLEDAARYYSGFENSSDYQDLHAWHFVPSSFELLLLELGRLGETDWQVERITTTAGWEFFAWLRRGAGTRIGSMSVEELDCQRMALLKRILLDTQAQIDYLLASEPELATEQAGLSTWATPLMHQAATAALEKCQDRLLAMETLYITAMQRVSALEASTSWRATAPFRILLDRMRRTVTAPFRPAK